MIDPPHPEDATAKCAPPALFEDEAPPPPADETGQTFGPYKILRKLGAGGFGTVYEAEQEQPVKRHVALKLIKLGMDTHEVIARFEAERQALALMEHPNIARVLDVGTTAAGRPYFVMELVHGEPISSYCDKHQLSIVERLKLFDQVCQAVQHAHTKGVIHRDLKTNNVLVSSDNDQPLAKVIDFGIAKATSGHLTDRGLLTAQVQMIGTPHYMSPEQAQGSADIDTRTDIYSLGVLLYQLLTNATPFESSSMRSAQYAEILRIICEVEPPRPSVRLTQSKYTLDDVASKRGIEPRKLIKTVRGELDWIVMMAIEKDRTRRYETANALAMDVRRYLSGQPLLAAPPSTVYRVKKFVRRHQLAVGAGLMVAASLVVGVVGFAWQARIAKQQAHIAEQQAHIAQQRAAELELVATFSANMFKQMDPTAAGQLLSKDVRAKFEQALTKAGVPESERAARIESFTREWQQVNATDAARALIDSAILKPAVDAIDKQFKGQGVVDAAVRQVLANRYVEVGLFAAALPLQEQALATRRRVLGEEHPDTLTSISAMGGLLIAQGKLSEAEPYVREALDKRRRVLGEDHPDTLSSINALAVLLYSQGKQSEAEPYYNEALEKRRRVLGEEHPDTIRSIELKGRRLMSQGKLSEAEPYSREALEKMRRVMGEEHPSTLWALNSMGLLRYLQGRLSEAEPYYREVLEKRRRVLGEEHPRTLDSIRSMGDLLRQQGKLSEAEAYFRDALEKERRVLGEENPSTLDSLEGRGGLLQDQGKLSEAEPYFREALEKRRRVQGDEHQDTLSSIILMGSLHVAQGRYAEAVELLAPAEAATRKAFTVAKVFPGASVFARFLTILGKARMGLGQHAAAEANLLEASSIVVQFPGLFPRDKRECTQAIVDLYTAWQTAEPGKGYDTKASEWKRKLDELDAAGAAPVASKPST